MKIFIKQAHGCLTGILILAGLICLALLFLHGGVWFSKQILPWLLPSAKMTLGIVLLVLLPLSWWWPTRRIAAKGLLYASGIFGLTLWKWGLILTYNLWGGMAVLVGLFLVGVGVVPMAMFATAFKSMWPTLGQLIALAVLTYGTRRFGRHLLIQEKAAEQKVYEMEIVQ